MRLDFNSSRSLPLYWGLFLTVAGAALSAGCQGQKSSKPPVHLNLNMDFQSSLKSQEETELFADGRAMRPQVAGTIPRSEVVGSEEFRTGKKGDTFVPDIPSQLSRELVDRGQDRYAIYCTPCHGGAGYADGLVTKRGGMKPPSFHEDRLVSMPAGQMFEAMSKGVRGNMPSYANKLTVADRWAVVSYVRALQISQNTGLENVPEDIARSKGWK
jgi:mono/diheme cytochrome c family protein